MFADIFHGLFAYYESRGARFFRALGEGNVIAWGFLALALIGLVMKCAQSAGARAAAPVKAGLVETTASCPRCSGAIRGGASYCRHCREWLDR